MSLFRRPADRAEISVELMQAAADVAGMPLREFLEAVEERLSEMAADDAVVDATGDSSPA